jgi:hypothetical protein
MWASFELLPTHNRCRPSEKAVTGVTLFRFGAPVVALRIGRNAAVRGPWNLCIAKKVAITVRLAPEMIFEWPALEQIPFKERRTLGARLSQVLISCQGEILK